MRIKQTEAGGFSYLVATDTTEYVFLMEGLRLLAEAFGDSTEDRYKYRALALTMYGEMEAASRVRQHLPIQDETVSTSGGGDQAHVPAMAEGTRVGASVRPENR